MIRKPTLYFTAVLLGAAVAPVHAATTGTAPPRCADLLGAAHRRPPHLVFTGCRSMPDMQGKPLRATYRVDGRYAAVAEAALVRTIGLARLRRSCCQWDAPPRRFTAGGREYVLTMASGETPVTSRRQWHLIRSFEVRVETFTEEI